MVIPPPRQRPFIQYGNDAVVGFDADCPPEALPQFDLHVGQDDSLDVVPQGKILIPLRFMDGIGYGERQARDDQRGHDLSGEVHALPQCARAEQYAVAATLELLHGLPRIAAHGEQRVRQMLFQ